VTIVAAKIVCCGSGNVTEVEWKYGLCVVRKVLLATKTRREWTEVPTFCAPL
jgi:hypothetical protein